MQIKLLKQLDRTLGRLLTGILPSPGRPGPCRLDRVLFIRPGGIGDVVHLIPTLRLLRAHAPACEIDVLVEQRNRGVLGLCAEVDRVYQYDTVKDLFSLAHKRYDVIIDTEQWHRLSAVVACLLRSDWKIGYQTNERGRLFTHGVDYSHQEYEAFSFWRLLEPIGAPVPEELPSRFLTLPETARRKADVLLDDYRERRIVTIFPFASIPERQWDVACFRQVARWCLDQGLAVVMVGGAGDRQAGCELVEGLAVLNLAGQISLVETAAVMEQSSLVLSGDSGPLHIAVGLDRPTVSLFGPGVSDKWAPRGAKHVVLNKQLPCSPCTRFGTTPPCPYGVRCMKQITTQDVILAIDGLLST